MCKRNSYLFFFALFLSIVISICVSNKYLLYFLSILFLSTSVGKKHLKTAYLSFFCTLFNIFCGKLLFFCKILLLFDTFLWITRDLTKRDYLVIIGNFFNSTSIKKIIITMLYFPKIFKKELDYDDGEVKFFRIIKQAYKRTKEKLRRIYNDFEKRLYFTKKDHFDKTISQYDIVCTCVIILIFFFSISL